MCPNAIDSYYTAKNKIIDTQKEKENKIHHGDMDNEGEQWVRWEVLLLWLLQIIWDSKIY